MHSNRKTTFAEDGLPQDLPDRLHKLTVRAAAKNPDQIALSDPERRITYGEMDKAIEMIAARLRSHGVRPGDRVAIVLENYVGAAAAIYAVSACEAIVSPINARIAAPEIAAMCQRLRPRCVIYIGSSEAARAHCEGLELVEIADAGFGVLLVGPVNDVETDPLPAPALVMFTSGTTGRPKGVMHSHASIIYQGASQALARSVTSEDVLYIVAPLSHTIGLGSNLMTACVAGAEAILSPRFDPVDIAQAIANGRITFIVAVPQVYAKLLDTVETQGISLDGHRMRFTGTGGAPVDVTLKERMKATFGLPFGNAYGCTEMTPITRVPDGIEASGDAIGIASPGCEVRVVGADGADAATDEVGEIWARGPSQMLGYYKDPQETAAVITSDGWLKTGDLGRRDASGQYFIAGRNKELIIRSGFNVYPAEVETVLNAYPGIIQSAVVGRKVEGNEEIIAYVQPAAGTAVDMDDLRRHCRENLSGYKMPARILITQMPVGPTGKILKSELARRAQDLTEP